MQLIHAYLRYIQIHALLLHTNQKTVTNTTVDMTLNFLTHEYAKLHILNGTFYPVPLDTHISHTHHAHRHIESSNVTIYQMARIHKSYDAHSDEEQKHRWNPDKFTEVFVCVPRASWFLGLTLTLPFLASLLPQLPHSPPIVFIFNPGSWLGFIRPAVIISFHSSFSRLCIHVFFYHLVISRVGFPLPCLSLFLINILCCLYLCLFFSR